ncbi:hypothetical protein BAR24066_04522 [Burkholderia arboris]|uniref:Uncharacterized protein n=1 Tax=Burkholderia arboris TaxID=488730 RepID=A0A9Q9USN6_9BURK|nr:hypothetical protein BAR24066_04522 [Burkholderia arboris]
MLSCRSMKGPLIFVLVLMHRETNLQVENEETIEAQSARTPKRCWTESNSAFSFACTDCHRWCIGRRDHPVAPAFAPPLFRASRRPSAFPVPVIRLQTARHCARAVRAYPVGVRETRPLHSAFADRAVGKTVGSSPTSRMQKRECGWMSSAGRWFGAGGAAGAARSSRGAGQVFAAFPSRSAACMRVATPSRVVALASVSASS